MQYYCIYATLHISYNLFVLEIVLSFGYSTDHVVKGNSVISWWSLCDLSHNSHQRWNCHRHQAYVTVNYSVKSIYTAIMDGHAYINRTYIRIHTSMRSARDSKFVVTIGSLVCQIFRSLCYSTSLPAILLDLSSLSRSLMNYWCE